MILPLASRRYVSAITTEQALELFRVRPQETGGNVDYDKLIKVSNAESEG